MIGSLLNAKKSVGDLLSRLMRMVCVGEVIAVDAEGMRVKVRLPNHDNMQSDWLRVIAVRALGVSASFNLTVGEQVLCLFPPLGDMLTGYVLGAIYNSTDKPFQTNPAVFGMKFEDGTIITYYQDASHLNVLFANGQQLEMTNDITRIVSNVEIMGELTVSENINGAKNIDAGKNITAAKTVSAKTVNGQSVSDSTGSIKKLRKQYNNHGHPNRGSGKPTVPMS